MAILKSIQSGNFTDSSTWGIVDQGSYLFQNHTSVIQISGTLFEGSNFTVSSNITISGVMIQLGFVNTGITNPSTNFQLRFHNVTTATDLKTVTIRYMDLPTSNSIFSATRHVGWVYFKFDEPITLSTLVTYRIRLQIPGGATSLTVYGTSTNIIDRALVTTTNGVPAATDTLIINGEYISTTVFNRITVTMNNTNTSTIFGQTFVDVYGTLRWADTPSSNFHFRVGGNVYIRGAAELIMGDSVTPIPSSTKCSLEISCSTPGQFIIYLGSNGKIITNGADLGTYKTELNADIATGNWVQTPNNTATQLTGDFEIELQNVTFKTETGAQSIYAKYNDFSNSTSNLMVGFTSTTSRLFLLMCQGSSQFLYTVPSNLDPNFKFFKITRNSTTGLIEFYQSTNGVYSTPFHTVTGITGTINAGTTRSTIGTRDDLGARFTGSVGRIILRKSIGGAISAEFNMSDYVSGTTMNSGGLTWTFNSIPSPTLPDIRFSTSDAFFITSTPTDWVVGDRVLVASTTRTADQTELVTVSAVSGNTVYISNTFSFPHLGTGDIKADVGKLDRNVRIFSTSVTNYAQQIYLANDAASVYLKNTEFYDFGTTQSTTSISGTNFNGLFTLIGNSIYSSVLRNVVFINYNGNRVDIVDNNLFYNTTNRAVDASGRVNNLNTPITFTNNLFMSTAGFAGPINGNFNNNIICGRQNSVAGLSVFNKFSGTLDNIKIYGMVGGIEFNGNILVDFLTVNNGNIINNARIFRCNGSSVVFATSNNTTTQIPIIFESGRFFGNTTSQIQVTGFSNLNTLFRNCSFWGGATEVTPTLITRNTNVYGQTMNRLFFDNCRFGTDYNGNVSNFSSAIIALNGAQNAFFNNCLFSGTEASTPGVPMERFTGYISVNHNQIPGAMRTFKSSCITLKDTTIIDELPSSIRLIPQSTSFNSISDIYSVPVKSGQTVTVSVRVRKSASPDTAYNGTQPQLIYLINPATGNYFNTPVATGTTANGEWETLSYTTPTINVDTVLEFYVLCNASAGFINISNFKTNTYNNSKSNEYWGFNGSYIEPFYKIPGTKISSVF